MNLETYLFLFIVFLIMVVFYYKKEGFTNGDNKTIVLLGDSMLANNGYVKSGYSIQNIIEKTFYKGNFLMLAKNNSTIQDVFHQLDKIPFDLDKPTTNIFLSVGGNDLLKNNLDLIKVNKIFDRYALLVDSIITKLPNAKIYLLTLYFPLDQPDHPYVNVWNKKIKQLMPFRNIIDTSMLITSKNDLVYNIEPSLSGGQKIANAILQRV